MTRPTTRLFTIFALLLIMQSSLGCARAGIGVGGKSPTFALERIERVDRGPDATQVNFVIRGANATDNAYPLREVEYTVSIDGRIVFRGFRDAQATLPPGDSQIFTVPAPIRYDEVGRLAGRTVRYEITGAVAYLPPGPIAEILYDLGIQRRRVPFRDGGLLEIPADDELPEFLRRPPEAESDAADDASGN